MTMEPQRHLEKPRPVSARERAIPIALIAEMDLAAIPDRSQMQQNRGFRASWSKHPTVASRLARSRPSGRAAKSP